SQTTSKMKISIFFLILLAGTILAEDCEYIGRQNCPDAFEDYDPTVLDKYCAHVTKVQECLKGVHDRCHTHYYHTYQDICVPI
ncbi:hypothetical protein, partial [Campylobacter fetus]|uniref:hypothetical protein n=1 Tax=Campylobacter fetus TaxID=196 RepID=UPI001F445A6A